LGFALVALPGNAGAQTTQAPRTYLVTIMGGWAAGNVVVHEVLSLERNGGESRIAVAGADGSIVSIPARFTPDGQIASNSNDAGVTCYNMAMEVVARAGTPSADPASVFLRFANSVVQVPLAVRAVQRTGSQRTTTLQGISRGVFGPAQTSVDAGIDVNATVEQDGDALRGASFDEVQYVGTREHVVGRSTCSLLQASESQAPRT
jgi:hypothetical protein